MSNLLVQNIKHTNNTTSMTVDSSGQVTIRGEGSATTTNLQQGLCKVWCNFNGDGTIATRDSFNVSGLTDNSTGDYTVSINSNMGNDDYSYVIGKRHNRPADGDGSVSSTTTSQFEHNTRDGNVGSSREDSDRNYSAVFGDLA